MNKFEELTKLKELLDSNIITQEEFDKKKKELLDDDNQLKDNQIKKEKKIKKIETKTIKKILIVLVALIVIVIGVFVGKKLIETNNHKKRAEALTEHIKPIMDKYGIKTFEVKPGDYSSDYDVYTEDFEELKNIEALMLLKELSNSSSIKDPCGGEDIQLGSVVEVYPSFDSDYCYELVSSARYYVCNQTSACNIKEGPGIYTTRNGWHCIFPYEN